MENKKLIKKLKKEQDKLNKKLWKLLFFIADQEDSQTISDSQLNLLNAQSDAMSKYSDILGMRINDLEEHHD
ncbi:crAss001_48 related protein [Limosilactobacillus mucosae]|uniref:crAss001_48 related protein n=1 Tax=Limosilactobacillus mucosae TaxID=97478 RepID=UPI004039B903